MSIYLQPILITEEYLKAYSPLPTNFDYEDIRPFIPIAESVWIVPIIGRALYDELIEQVIDNEVTGVNSTLLLKIYPLLSMAVVYESLPFIWAHLSEKSITLGKSDNSESINSNDLNSIQNHLKSQLSVLKEDLKEFLNKNASCYPLYAVENDCCNKKNDGDIRLYTNNIRRQPRNF